jgi:knotted carbamoyltransferase YgeW
MFCALAKLEEAMSIAALAKSLEKLDCKKSFGEDFLLTWEKSVDELTAVFAVADALRELREEGLSAKIFDSGLAVSLFRDNSTRTRFSFASACNFLGLSVSDLDEGKSQIAHGETLRETTNMISFMADVIGIRDDMFIGKGNAYMRAVAKAAASGCAEGTLEQRPTVVNLQCDLDHPTQIMADMDHIIHEFGGIENLKGKKVAMTWAYSPSYGKPLSVPQGVCGLMTRFGMEVALAHPEGYEIMPEVEELAIINAAESGGKFSKSNSMADAFEGADIVYPKSWAPFKAMERRSSLYAQGDTEGIKSLEKELLSQNAYYKSWECTKSMMSITSCGKARYLHCLPADISGVSCESGEVSAKVFDKHRMSLYKQASYKPYVIAAMIFLSKVKDPVKGLQELAQRGVKRALL